MSELPDRTNEPWTGPEQLRHACALAGGWPWCDIHRRSPWREDGCIGQHPELQYRPHTQECMVDDTGPCFCGADDDEAEWFIDLTPAERKEMRRRLGIRRSWWSRLLPSRRHR